MELEKLYTFEFAWSLWETGYQIMSVHKTLKGAYKAMKEHRLNHFEEWRNSPNFYRVSFKDTHDKDWRIGTIDVLE